MKKNQTVAAAKKAQKAFKKELTQKITAQLKVIADETGTDSKKTNKAIEKAAKNLAKKISKYNIVNKVVANTEDVQPIVDVKTPAPEKTTKTKSSAVKKAANPSK